MTDGPQETWTITKPAARGKGGVVASQHYEASAIGVRVLREGGNAVDAAVAMGLAIGAVEPWMSGIGGGGFMIVWQAKERKAWCVGFGMPSPRGLDPKRYPLTGTTRPGAWWPEVEGDRNLMGYESVGVPGVVDGLATALERFGTRPFAQMVQPAAALAERGMTVDWYATARIAGEAKRLAGHAESARVFLPGGLPAAADSDQGFLRLKLGRLAETYRRLARHGPRDFYEGGLAADIAADVQAGGGALGLDDLRAYRATVAPALSFPYRDVDVHAAAGLNAGPSLKTALDRLGAGWTPGPRPDAAAFAAYADALAHAYAERLTRMGDPGLPSGCTTHLSVADGEGNMVALTQTLLFLFGSMVMLPRTGILLNNAIAWFDPRPGTPNAIAPAKWPLTNMCPVAITRNGEGLMAAGASGGRRILPAVMQLASFVVDHGMDAEAAAHHPRIDVSGTELATWDPRLGPDVAAAVGRRLKAQPNQPRTMPVGYACPNIVVRERAGGFAAAAFVNSPWSKAEAA